MGETLTQKQEKFVQGLIKGKSQRESYKSSYNAKKMSDNSIDVNACKLLKNAKVALRYTELNNKIIKRSEEKAIITAEEIIKGIAQIARDDISNYLNFETREVTIGVIDNVALKEDRITVDIKDSKTIDTRNISEVSLGKDGQFKFKLYERDKALYKLAEMFGLSELSKAKQKLEEDKFEYVKSIAEDNVEDALSKLDEILKGLGGVMNDD